MSRLLSKMLFEEVIIVAKPHTSDQNTDLTRLTGIRLSAEDPLIK